MIRRFGVESETLAWLSSASAASTLYRRRLRDRDSGQALYTRAWIVSSQFHEACVNNVDDAVYGHRRLGNVGGQDDFACVLRSRLEDIHLCFSREAGVER